MQKKIHSFSLITQVQFRTSTMLLLLGSRRWISTFNFSIIHKYLYFYLSTRGEYFWKQKCEWIDCGAPWRGAAGRIGPALFFPPLFLRLPEKYLKHRAALNRGALSFVTAVRDGRHSWRRDMFITPRPHRGKNPSTAPFTASVKYLNPLRSFFFFSFT